MKDPELWDRKAWIIRLLAEGCYERRDAPVFLSSGVMSNDYIDCRKLTLAPEGIALVAREICWRIVGCPVDFIGGPTVGADPIVSSTILFAKVIWHKNIQGFLTRKEEKTHGLGGRIVGRAPNIHSQVVLVDDVLTSGASLKSSIYTVAALKAPIDIVKCIVIVDRTNGTMKEIEGIPVESICTLQEIITYAQENNK